MTDIDLEAAIAQVMEDIPEEEFAALLEQFLLQGQSAGNIIGYDDAQMEGIYALAYNVYNAGKYDEAERLFSFLCQADHLEKKYWMGLGGTRKMLGQYEQAAQAYGMAGLLGIEEPEPPMEAAECHLAAGDREAALSGFRYAVETSANRPEFQELKQRAEARVAMLEAE